MGRCLPIIVCRYADDLAIGCQQEADGKRLLAAVRDRLMQFGLSLHEDKTRLIAFGRLPAMARQQRGERRPETFAFLGFTHYCGWTRDGRFIVKRKTQSKRLTRKLKAVRQAWRLMHAPMAEQQRWYASILRGHYAYYGLPHNWRALNAFHRNLMHIWFRHLRRRSQKARRLGWNQFKAMLVGFPLPVPRITHPWVGDAA
jgi:RNA-directed DNA polymerase